MKQIFGTTYSMQPIKFRGYSLLHFLAIFFVVLLNYGALLHKHYALDTYVVEAYGNVSAQHAALGRFVSAAILKICTLAGVNTAVQQSWCTAFSICVLSGTIYFLFHFFVSLQRQQQDNRSGRCGAWFLLLAVVTALCNVFVLHWFLFPEVVYCMALGSAAVVWALYALRKGGVKGLFLTFFALLFALSCYQAVGAFFVGFALLYIFCVEESLGAIVKKHCLALAVYTAAGVSNIVLIKLWGMGDARTAFQQTDILANMRSILPNILGKLYASELSLFPLYLFAFFPCVFLLLGGVDFYKNRKKGDVIFSFLYIFVITSVAVFVPHLLTSEVDISPRSIAALGSIPGLFAILFFLRRGCGAGSWSFRLLTSLLFVYLIINTFFSWWTETSRFAVNRLDKQEALLLWNEIQDYEKSSGSHVVSVATHHDIAPTNCYRNQLCYGNSRAMGRRWSLIPLLNIVSKRQFVERGMSPTLFNSCFARKNWNHFSKDQLQFRENQLFLMLY